MDKYLHHRPPRSIRHNYGLLLFKGNAPDRFRRLRQLAQLLSGAQVPDLDAPIAATADDARVVELQASHAVVMRGETVDGPHLRQGPHSYRTVGTAGHERIAAHLELADEGGVALKDGMALARVRIPDAHTGVETACGDSFPIKGDGVNLAEMPG